jgi:hypothetical protein
VHFNFFAAVKTPKSCEPHWGVQKKKENALSFWILWSYILKWAEKKPKWIADEVIKSALWQTLQALNFSHEHNELWWYFQRIKKAIWSIGAAEDSPSYQPRTPCVPYHLQNHDPKQDNESKSSKVWCLATQNVTHRDHLGAH